MVDAADRPHIFIEGIDSVPEREELARYLQGVGVRLQVTAPALRSSLMIFADAALWAGVAAAVVAYIKARVGRSIKVKTNGGKSIEATGLSAKELADLMPLAEALLITEGQAAPAKKAAAAGVQPTHTGENMTDSEPATEPNYSILLQGIDYRSAEHRELTLNLNGVGVKIDEVHAIMGMTAHGLAPIMVIFANAALWTGIAAAVIAYIKARHGRSIKVKTKDGQSIEATGLSANELADLLPVVQSMTFAESQAAPAKKTAPAKKPAQGGPA